MVPDACSHEALLLELRPRLRRLAALARSVEHTHADLGRLRPVLLGRRGPELAKSCEDRFGVGLLRVEGRSDSRVVGARHRRERHHLEAVRIVRVDAPERRDQLLDVVAVERLVGLELRNGLVGDVERGREAVHGLAERLRREPLHEGLLPIDATEVAAGIRLPTAVDVLLHAPRPHVVERGGAVEGVAAGVEVERDELETAVRVSRGRVDVDGDAAHGVDDALEALEVDLEVVLDGNVEVLLERVDHSLGPAAGVRVERGIDLLLAEPRYVDGQVTGERDEKTGLLLWVDVDHHERVRPLTAAGSRVAKGRPFLGCLHLGAGVGPDEEEVGRLAGVGVLRGLDLHAGDLADLPVDERVHEHHAAQDEREGHRQRHCEAPEQDAGERACHRRGHATGDGADSSVARKTEGAACGAATLRA